MRQGGRHAQAEREKAEKFIQDVRKALDKIRSRVSDSESETETDRSDSTREHDDP